MYAYFHLPRNGARGLRRLAFLKYYILKWKASNSSEPNFPFECIVSKNGKSLVPSTSSNRSCTSVNWIIKIKTTLFTKIAVFNYVHVSFSIKTNFDVSHLPGIHDGFCFFFKVCEVFPIFFQSFIILFRCFFPISLKLFQKSFLKLFYNINNINFELPPSVLPNNVSIIFLESLKIFFSF